MVRLGLHAGGQLGGADEVAEHDRQPPDLPGRRGAGLEQVGGVEVLGIGGEDLVGQRVARGDIAPVEGLDGPIEEEVGGGRPTWSLRAVTRPPTRHGRDPTAPREAAGGPGRGVRARRCQASARRRPARAGARSVEVDGLRRALGDEALRPHPEPHHPRAARSPSARRTSAEAFDVAPRRGGGLPAPRPDPRPGRHVLPGEPGGLPHGGRRPRGDVPAGRAQGRPARRPIDRPEDWPYVPHVTVARAAGGAAAAARSRCWPTSGSTVQLRASDVLAEQEGRVWTPVADAALGAA